MKAKEDLSKTYPEYKVNYRPDGRIEVICPDRGIGHTIWYPKGSSGIHGCDLCCSNPRFLELSEKFLEQHFGNNTKRKNDENP